MSSRTLIFAIIGTALLLFTAHPSHASISFIGGTTSQQDALRRVYDHIPACCQAQCPICVQLMDDNKMDSYLRAAEGAQAAFIRNSAVDGVYQNNIPTVTLRVHDTTADVSATFAHEYGHFVWQRLLTRDQRNQFERIYKSQAASHHLISPYAAVSVEEGFAETFSFFTRQHDYLATCDPQSCQCLDDFIRANGSVNNKTVGACR